MFKWNCVALLAAVLAVSVTTASAATMSFTAGYNDETSGINWVTSEPVRVNSGMTEVGSVLYEGTNYEAVALYHFDLSTLPAYSAINSVTLNLVELGGEPGGASGSMSLYRVANAYSGWDADASWAFSNGAYWYTNGNPSAAVPWANSATMGQVGTGGALATTVVNSTLAGQVYQWTITGSAASTMVSDWTTGTNSGLLLSAGPGDAAGDDTRTAFYTGSTLTINYTTVPEPSALVLTGIGLLSLLAYAWRKRR